MPDAALLYDLGAERGLLAGMLAYRGRVGDVAACLEPGDFFGPAHARMFAAMVELHTQGEPVDATTVAAWLRQSGAAEDVAALTEVVTDPGVVVPHASHARTLVALRAARELAHSAQEALDAVRRGVDPYGVAGELSEALGRLESVGAVPSDLSSWHAFLETPECDPPVVVPGLLFADTRVILVSSEGGGKSTVARQLVWCASQGIHPWFFNEIEPVSALAVDLENPSRELRQSGGFLRRSVEQAAGPRYDPSRLHLLRRPQGADLRDRRFRGELEGALEATRPKIVTIGPINKMAYRRRDETHEDMAEGVQRVLDDLRTRYGFALVIEAHAPHGEDHSRVLRPMNSVRWLSWPDVVIGLRKDDTGLEVEHARGDRGIFDWPVRLDRDRAWPFVGVRE